MEDDFFEEDPDEIDDEGDCEDCVDEPEDLDFSQDKVNAEPAQDHEYLDPFYLGVAAGFGYEMGIEERPGRNMKK